MEKVLITGSNGQLGSDCFNLFNAQNNLQEVMGLDIPVIDFSDKKQCFDLLNSYIPNVIINCAAYTAVDKCESDKNCWRANFDIPDYLSSWSSQNDAFLIHISTDYVFDGKKSLNEVYTELDAVNPVSEYGRSKLEGEKIIQKNMRNFAILRTAWLYGISGNNFLKTMLKLSNDKNDKSIKIVNDQFGSPTSSKTLAKQIDRVYQNKLKGIYHATSEGKCSWYDFAVACAEEMDMKNLFIPCQTNEYPTPAKRPNNSVLENSNFKKINENCFTDWKNELKDFISCHRDLLIKELNLS